MFEFEMLLVAQQSFWNKIVDVFTTPSLQLFLLLGSFVLAISLLLLTMTRLGHARPITKCVVLSVIAHILLLGYAYGTKMIFHVPVAQQPESIKVSLGEPEIEEKEEAPAPTDSNLVDKFANDSIVLDANELERPEEESPFELERVFETDLKQNTVVQKSPNPIDVQKLEAQSPLLNTQEPDLQFNDDESFDSPTAEPTEIDFQRHGENEQDIQNRAPEFEAEKPIDAAEDLQKVEIEPSILDQNSFPTETERAEQFESELVLPDPQAPIANEYADTIAVETTPPTNASETTTEPLENSKPVEVHRLADGQKMPSSLALRANANRAAAARARGGTRESEAAVEAALQWLASVQEEDGHWCPRTTSAGREDKVFGHDRGGCGSDADSGITALATLAFLGAGNTHLEGPYRENVQRALEFLIRQQTANGDCSGNAKLFARMYCHSMSLLALSEALAMTGDHRLRQAVNLGVDFTAKAQNRDNGGWRYQPGDSGDMSQFGWKVMALHSAALGSVNVDHNTKQRMKKFLATCQTGQHGGLASYRPNEGPSTTMTAEALVCKYFLRQPIELTSLAEAKQRILSELPTTTKPNLYYWYYATLALYHAGGEDWDQWNHQLQRVLLSQQQSSGTHAGSWEPNGMWAGYGGRVYSTALATMCLEVYYRYQPYNGSMVTKVINFSDQDEAISR